MFLILKISQYGTVKRWVQLFPRYPCKNWYKYLFVHFYKTYDHQIWKAVTFTGFDSNEKLKTYIHYQSAYSHQTLPNGNLPRWTPAHKVTWPFDHVVFWGRLTTWNHYISITTMPMATKLGKLVTWHEGLPPIMLLDPLVTWSCEIMWQTKIIISPLPQYLWPQS